MRDLRVKEMTTAGIFGAIILALSLIPAPWGATMGFIRVGFSPVELTIIHIPVIIGGIFGGKRVAIMLGAMFGVGSLLAAIIYGGVFAPFFYNPLVSILPRILFGYFIYLFYRVLSKYIKNPTVSMTLTMALSTIAHSLMVLTLLFLFAFTTDTYQSVFPDYGLIAFLLFFLGWNAFLEVVIAVLVGTPIGLRIKEYKDQE